MRGWQIFLPMCFKALKSSSSNVVFECIGLHVVFFFLLCNIIIFFNFFTIKVYIFCLLYALCIPTLYLVLFNNESCI